MPSRSARGFSRTRTVAAGVLALSLILVAAAGPVAADTGPYLVKDINTSGSSSPRELTELNGKVYFSASGGAKGRELWVSDGTANGTRRVKDIRPGSQGSQPFGLIASNGLMYFNANDGTTGQELWVTDGTTTGTRLVKDIGPGVASGNPLFFTPVNGTVFFSADDGVKGRELWRTDGSEAGTQLVKDIVPGMQGSTPWELTEFADKLVFRATRCPTATCVTTLFKSNGTAAGTKPFKDRDGHLVTGDIHDLRVVGSQLYFYKDEGEIWRSKGDSSTLRSLGDFDPSTPIVDSGNRAFFTVGFELWKSNGTPGGTVKVTQVDTDWPEDLFDLDGTLFFWAGALYRSDGTAEGTVQVGPDHQSLYLEADQMAALDGFLYYAGLSVHQGSCLEGDRTLWRSDGTPSGTLEVSPTPEACNLGYLTPLDGALFFAAGDGVSNVELWRYVP